MALYVAVFASASAVLAPTRRRPARRWALYGALVGPVALVVLLVAPPGACASCGARVHVLAQKCWFCGEPVAGSAPDDEASEHRTPASPAPPSQAATMPVARLPEDRPPVAARLPALPAQVSVSSGAAPGLIPTRVLASAVLLVGAAPLMSGCRYQLEVTSETLRVVGPVDAAPGVVVLEAPLRRIDATSIHGRVLVTEIGGKTPRILGAFTMIAGLDPETLADELVVAAGVALAAEG